MFDSMTKTSLFTQVVLLAHGIAYFAMGATGFLNPVSKFSRLGFEIPATAITTFRVIYGGLMIGIALTFAASAFIKGMQPFGLIALILVMASLILTRTGGALMDRSFEPSQFLWSGIEFMVLVLSVVLFRAQAKA